TGRSFFPKLIEAPFRIGLHEAFAFAIVACLVAAVASFSRGGRAADADTGQPEPSGSSSTGAAARDGRAAEPVAR
ncbi:MAG TPA: hypothetical protein VG325_08530, partial [Solirubrobacteraceae bacterium]|nr:hypothetical protein [Solirubrobacteraceae bacterium]